MTMQDHLQIMEQIEMPTDTRDKPYEYLTLHERLEYWVDYLQRVIAYSLNTPDLTSEQHSLFLAEINQILVNIKILRNEPSTRSYRSKASTKPAK